MPEKKSLGISIGGQHGKLRPISLLDGVEVWRIVGSHRAVRRHMRHEHQKERGANRECESSAHRCIVRYAQPNLKFGMLQKAERARDQRSA
jgi:hypothetical protein